MLNEVSEEKNDTLSNEIQTDIISDSKSKN